MEIFHIHCCHYVLCFRCIVCWQRVKTKKCYILCFFHLSDLSLDGLLSELEIQDASSVTGQQYAVIQEKLGLAEFLLVDTKCKVNVSPFTGLGVFNSGKSY